VAAGAKISSKEELLAAGVDVRLVAQRATEAYLIQILRVGFFVSERTRRAVPAVSG